MKNKYFHRREEPTSTPTRFFLVGTVTNSSLLSGDISRNISISFSNRTFPRAIAAVGDVLSEKVLFLPTFQQGVSITTARRPTKGTGQATIRGLTPSSHYPRRHNEMEQRMPPFMFTVLQSLLTILSSFLQHYCLGMLKVPRFLLSPAL